MGAAEADTQQFLVQIIDDGGHLGRLTTISVRAQRIPDRVCPATDGRLGQTCDEGVMEQHRCTPLWASGNDIPDNVTCAVSEEGGPPIGRGESGRPITLHGTGGVPCSSLTQHGAGEAPRQR